eukprot:13534997-Ditylum_brightwellii.AAC.1
MEIIEHEETISLKRNDSKLKKRVQELEHILLSPNKRVKKLELLEKKQRNENSFLVGEHVLYCSKPAYKKKDEIGVIVQVTKESVWVGGDNDSVKVRRHKKMP